VLLKNFYLKSDCRHFKGDRPCQAHKDSAVLCPECNQYEAVDDRILIIKLDAMGDVLRSTSILRPLKNRYPASQITWITSVESVDLFKNLPEVDRVLAAQDYHTQSVLEIENFSRMINLDASPKSAGLASRVKCKDWFGYKLGANGQVEYSNEAAGHWLQMGAFDPLKKENKKTYQQLMLEILGISSNEKHPILWSLNKDEITWADEEFRRLGLSKTKKTLGLNTGASPRWKQKKWTSTGFEELIKKVSQQEDGLQIVLLGGPHEEARNKKLKAKFPQICLSRTDYSIREFAALLSMVDIALTGDTMALHLSLALNKRVVALFGPTSIAEIEMYGQGTKLAPVMDCLCCYLPDCDVKVKCMQALDPALVFNTIIAEYQKL